jgi:hypothetical protein
VESGRPEQDEAFLGWIVACGLVRFGLLGWIAAFSPWVGGFFTQEKTATQ